jgi:hypothetical protein
MQQIIKNALKYFGIFILIYGTLTAISLLPAVGSAFNYIYRQPSQFILQTALPKAYLQLKSEKNTPDLIRAEFASKEKVQQQIEEAKKTGQAKTPVQGNSFEFGFYNLFLSFILFLFVLILLSPLNKKEKIISILIGTLIFYFYSVFKMYLALLSHFNEPEIAIYHTGESTLKFAQSILYYMSLGTNMLVVLIIWAVFVFRKNNWNALFGAPSSILGNKK